MVKYENKIACNNKPAPPFLVHDDAGAGLLRISEVDRTNNSSDAD